MMHRLIHEDRSNTKRRPGASFRCIPRCIQRCIQSETLEWSRYGMMMRIMCWNKNNYHPSPLLRGVQIVLLILILTGIGLLVTQDLWVSKFVDYLLMKGY